MFIEFIVFSAKLRRALFCAVNYMLKLFNRQVCSKNSRLLAFSLVEMLLALLVASLLMVALAPVMTKKFNESLSISGVGGTRADYKRTWYYDKNKEFHEWTVPYGVNLIKVTSVGGGGAGGGSSYGSVDIAANTTWTVPNGVTKLKVFMVGGGGSGASGGLESATDKINGGQSDGLEYKDFLSTGETSFTMTNSQRTVPTMASAAPNCYAAGLTEWTSDKTGSTSTTYTQGATIIPKVTACGAGGGGGQQYYFDGVMYASGTGGGSGGFAENVSLNNLPNTIYVKVGAGGNSGGYGAGASGGGFQSTVNVSTGANGGYGGRGCDCCSSNRPVCNTSAGNGGSGTGTITSNGGGGGCTSKEGVAGCGGDGGNGSIWGGGGGGGGKRGGPYTGTGGGGGGGPTTITSSSGLTENAILFQIGGGGGGGGSGGGSHGNVYHGGGGGGGGGGYGSGGGGGGGGHTSAGNLGLAGSRLSAVIGIGSGVTAAAGTTLSAASVDVNNGSTTYKCRAFTGGGGGGGYGGMKGEIGSICMLQASFASSDYPAGGTIPSGKNIFGSEHCNGGTSDKAGKPGALRLYYTYPPLKCTYNDKSNSGGGGGAGEIWIGEITVNGGDTVGFNIGTGGAAPTAYSSNGNDGGETYITINGSKVAAVSGGEGGQYKKSYVETSGGNTKGVNTKNISSKAVYSDWLKLNLSTDGAQQKGKAGNASSDGAGGGNGGRSYTKTGTLTESGIGGGAQANGADAPMTGYGAGGGGGGGVTQYGKTPGYGGKGANGYIYVEWGSGNGGGGGSGQVVTSKSFWVTPHTVAKIYVGKGGEAKNLTLLKDGKGNYQGYKGENGNDGGDSYVIVKIDNKDKQEATAKGGKGGIAGYTAGGRGGGIKTDASGNFDPDDIQPEVENTTPGESATDERGGMGGTITEEMCPLLTELKKIGLGGCGGNSTTAGACQGAMLVSGEGVSAGGIGNGGGGGAVVSNTPYKGGNGSGGMVTIEWNN